MVSHRQQMRYKTAGEHGSMKFLDFDEQKYPQRLMKPAYERATGELQDNLHAKYSFILFENWGVRLSRYGIPLNTGWGGGSHQMRPLVACCSFDGWQQVHCVADSTVLRREVIFRYSLEDLYLQAIERTLWTCGNPTAAMIACIGW